MFFVIYFLYVFTLSVCRGEILFRNGECECTIGQVAESFKANGMLCNYVFPVGTYLLGKKFENSEKLIVPFVCCVS